MKISDIAANKKINISCELFPPKEGAVLEKAEAIVSETAKLSPAFISVTCGAAGGNRDKTAAIAGIAKQSGVEALAHMTCVEATKESVTADLERLKANGVQNVLALRGDLVGDAKLIDFNHASDLAEFISGKGFCIGGACYPEGHPESGSIKKDVDNLKYKIDAGVEFLITQLFFDNTLLYTYLSRMRDAGINLPVMAGIMPVTSAAQVKRLVSISGSNLPAKLLSIVDRFGGDPASMKQAGIAYASSQIIDLIANGVTNIHVYTMNKPEIAEAIIANFSEIRKGDSQ